MSKVCKSCNAELPDTAKFCEKCGSSVTEEEKTENLFCRKCGAVLELGAKFCGKCGTIVDIETETGQELKQLTDSAKLAAKAGMNSARKGLAKGMALTGAKILSTANKLHEENKMDNVLQNADSVDSAVKTEETSKEESETKTIIKEVISGIKIEETSKEESKGKTIIMEIISGIVGIMVFLLMLNFLFGNHPVQDTKDIVFDEYGSQNLGEVIQDAIPEASWDSKKVDKKHYTVMVSGFCPNLSSEIQLNFDVHYFGEQVYVKIVSVIQDGEYYDDFLSVGFILAGIYGIE